MGAMMPTWSKFAVHAFVLLVECQLRVAGADTCQPMILGDPDGGFPEFKPHGQRIAARVSGVVVALEFENKFMHTLSDTVLQPTVNGRNAAMHAVKVFWCECRQTDRILGQSLAGHVSEQCAVEDMTMLVDGIQWLLAQALPTPMHFGPSDVAPYVPPVLQLHVRCIVLVRLATCRAVWQRRSFDRIYPKSIANT